MVSSIAQLVSRRFVPSAADTIGGGQAVGVTPTSRHRLVGSLPPPDIVSVDSREILVRRGSLSWLAVFEYALKAPRLPVELRQ